MAKSKLDSDIYSYKNAKKEKMWAYRYRYYDSLGKHREKSKQGFKTEKEAYRSLTAIKLDITNGDVSRVEHSNLTVSEWLDIWYDANSPDWKVSTRKQRKNVIAHIKALIGSQNLVTLSRTTYKSKLFLNVLAKKYAPGTVRTYHNIFKIAINSAVYDDLIPKNKFNRFTIDDDDSDNENFLTAAELDLLLKHVKESDKITNYTCVLLLAYSGLRKGEAQGLTWADINFDNSSISVRRTRDTSGVRTPKTKNSYRTISIDDSVMKQLKIYRTWCKKKMFSFGKILSYTDYVFISNLAEPISDNTIGVCLNRIAKRNNLKLITPHGLRHTHATILVANRVPNVTIAKRLGNTPEMISKVYSHSYDQLDNDSANIFSQAINSISS